MAHFAEVNENNIVVRVLVVPNNFEHKGQEYLADELGLGGRWIQTSYNDRIRKQYAGIGYIYDPEADVFIRPKPFESWSLDQNHDWQAPVARPNDGLVYAWNEQKQEWQSIDATEI